MDIEAAFPHGDQLSAEVVQGSLGGTTSLNDRILAIFRDTESRSVSEDLPAFV